MTEPALAPGLSLVFPAFNEAENLPPLLESAISIGVALDLDFEIVIVDDGSKDLSAELLTEAARRDGVFVGRIRDDISHDRGISLWVVADNVRKGAALNSVQIAEILVRDYI